MRFTYQARSRGERTYSRVHSSVAQAGKRASSCITLAAFVDNPLKKEKGTVAVLRSSRWSYTEKWDRQVERVCVRRGCDILVLTHRTSFFVVSLISVLLEGLKIVIVPDEFVRLVTEKEEKAHRSQSRCLKHICLFSAGQAVDPDLAQSLMMMFSLIWIHLPKFTLPLVDICSFPVLFLQIPSFIQW